MTDWTPERETAARARCDAASEGEWFTGAPNDAGLTAVEDGRSSGLFTFYAETHEAEFCAHARTDLPAALDEIQRLREWVIDAWVHREYHCPCSPRQRKSETETPAPLDECNCGLNRALYG